MVLQLYGYPSATCTLRVALVLNEKKVPFEFTAIDLVKGEHKTPEYLKYQPFGQIPYINDDGFILFETRAICRYIAAKYASQGTQGLVPTSPTANALFEQAASIEQSNFDPASSGAVVEKVYKPKYSGKAVDETAFGAHIATLDAKLNGYEAILSKQRYLGGDEITLADLFHVPNIHFLTIASDSDVLTKRPNVGRWSKELRARPAWLAVQDGVKTTTKY